MKTEMHWYTKLGELAVDYADKCVKMKLPVKGIHILQVGITKLQQGNQNLYTNLHYPFVLLCKQGHFLQHSLKIIDPKITDYKTVEKLDKITKPTLNM